MRRSDYFIVHVNPRMRGITAVATIEVVSRRRTTDRKEVESRSNTLRLIYLLSLIANEHVNYYYIILILIARKTCLRHTVIFRQAF